MSKSAPITDQNANIPLAIGKQSVLAQAITTGFGIAVFVWTTWFITHLPWTGLSEQIRLSIVMAAWLAAATVLAQAGSVRSSLAAGLVSAILGLLLLGSKLVEPSATGPQAGPVKPDALLIAAGFLALGATIGLAGWLVSRLLPRGSPDVRPDWLARFAVVTAVTVAVLLFIGGLVTSTNSGMAVPDWPRTFGANMFLYPLTGAAADVFLEHSHRLFGTLVGLATITLLIWTFAKETRGWVKTLAIIVLALVVIQGVLGGKRVTSDSRGLAMLHAVLGQVTFGLIIGIAAVLAPTFRSTADPMEPLPRGRRLRFLTTGCLHATILQLLLGAMHRHFRDDHSLYAHIGLSIIVMIMATGAGFAARATHGHHGGIGPVLRRIGLALVTVVSIQFALGWVAFLAAGRDIRAASAGQALIRTAHQANGALVLALGVLAFVWTRRLLRVRAESRP